MPPIGMSDSRKKKDFAFKKNQSYSVASLDGKRLSRRSAGTFVVFGLPFSAEKEKQQNVQILPQNDFFFFADQSKPKDLLIETMKTLQKQKHPKTTLADNFVPEHISLSRTPRIQPNISRSTKLRQPPAYRPHPPNG
jgi:hypothetical protein